MAGTGGIRARRAIAAHLRRLAALTVLLALSGLAACQTATGPGSGGPFPGAFRQTAAEETAERVNVAVADAIDRIAATYIDPVDEDALRRTAATYIVDGMQRGESEEALVKGAVTAMVGTLEGNGRVVDRELLSGRFGSGTASVGIFEAADGQGGWVIVRVHPLGALEGTPVRPGWRLMSIDGQPRQSMDKDDAIRRLQGEMDTPVQLGFLDPFGKPAAFNVRRVRLGAMEAVVNRCGTPAVVQIMRLTGLTVRELLRFLLDCEPDELVLDLRGNSGGTLDAVVDTAALFVGNSVVFHIRERDGVVERRKAGATRRYAGRLLVLTDRYTASGAELLVQALRRGAGALVAGETTPGHDFVHTVMPLKGDLIMALQTGRFEGPDGSAIVPVVPDIEMRDDWNTVPDEVMQAAPALLARSRAS
ncbi:MAG: S41 family peptidase [Minwuia sp.]|uniref:S41 family peptidase n=1 Tax=Minwuia sp. TaxID=2493630 RepID=UPI003A89FECA